ncbi:unnamed protein product [marine sediment metagenome]|uniref:Uncharacterized protein n=1 Tax=marine sediment metagenome TaxID=412755 RepID=X1NVW8_9ZZZZ
MAEKPRNGDILKTKLVQKDKKAEDKGTKFDKDGRMLIPVKQNGEIKMETQEAVQKILNKKKQKVDKSAKTNTKSE